MEESTGESLGPCLWLNLFCNHHVICSHVKAYFFSYLLRSRMRTYDAWFPRYALRNRLMFSRPPWDEEVPCCPLFSPAACKGFRRNVTSVV